MIFLILRFENISKNINRTEILKNINFEVERGEVVGIIGKNGSGKTTLLKLVSGLSYPTKGEIYFFDKKLEPGFVGRLPQNIGVLIETPSFISNLSGFDNLYYLSKIRNIISKDDITEMIEKVGLDSNNKNPFKTWCFNQHTYILWQPSNKTQFQLLIKKINFPLCWIT